MLQARVFLLWRLCLIATLPLGTFGLSRAPERYFSQTQGLTGC